MNKQDQPPTPDRCPTCGSAYQSVRLKGSTCTDMWHNTFPDAATPAPWVPEIGDTVRGNWDAATIYEIEGFESEGVAKLTKWPHHAIDQGVAGVDSLTLVMKGGALAKRATPATEPWRPKFRVDQQVRFDGECMFICAKGPNRTYDLREFGCARIKYTNVPEDSIEPYVWTMPTPPAGHEWHRQDFEEWMLPQGFRPLLKDEVIQSGDYMLAGPRYWTVCHCGETKQIATKQLIHFRTTRPLPAPTPPQPEPQPTTAQTAGEAAFAYNHSPPSPTRVHWKELDAYSKSCWEGIAQAAIAFAQSSRMEPKPLPTPQDVMRAASKKHSRMEQAKRNVEQARDVEPTHETCVNVFNDAWNRAMKAGCAERVCDEAGISAVREACMRAVPMTQDVEVAEFRECELCAQKPGSPPLCESCLNNRHAIWSLRQQAEAAEQTIADLRKSLGHREAFVKEVEKHRDRAAQEVEELRSALASMEEANKGNYATYDEAMKRLESDLAAAREELGKANQHSEDVFERYTEGVLKMVRNLGSKAEIDTSPGETEHETRGHILARAEDAIQALLDEARESLRKVEEERDAAKAGHRRVTDQWTRDLQSMKEMEDQLTTLKSELTITEGHRKNWQEKAENRMKELASLKASSGWVALSERKPTKEDGDEDCDILWRDNYSGTVTMAHWDKQPDDDHIHWMSIPPLPTPPPSPEEQERREFEKEWSHYRLVKNVSDSFKSMAYAFWQAARKTKGDQP